MTDRRQASPELAAEGQAFDLNIDKVLEHWTVPFAIRELIANALDEQALTGTAEPVICKDGTRLLARPRLRPRAALSST